MIFVYDGNPGQGKTYMLACDTLDLLDRNRIWYKKGKTKTLRKLYTNMALHPDIEAQYPDQIFYWQDLAQLVSVREADIIFDDMSTYLDSQRYLDTPTRVKRWLRLHEHYGCNIYGNAQDFLSIDISVRRLITTVTNVRKMIGSRRPYATMPPVKYIWGVLMLREVDEEEMDKERQKRIFTGWPRIEFLKRSYCNVFDTTQELAQGDWPSLECVIREAPCGEVKHTHR